MKPLILFFYILFASNSAFAQNQAAISIKDAIKQKLIAVSGVYNESSVHYLNPVVLTIISLTNQSIALKIESGDLMEPQDSNCQTMMITGDMIVKIKSGETKNIEPYGMCIEPNDAAGYKGLKYIFYKNRNPKLIEIARFIYDNKYNDGLGQQAVWCVADKEKSLLEINGYDSLSRLKLITKVAKIIGKPVPDAKLLRQGYADYVQPKKTETIGGMFEFKFSETTKVHIAMFDAMGILVRELYYNPSEKPGVHKIDFEFDFTVFTDEYYVIKLIANEEVLLTSKVDRSDDNWIEE